MSEYKFTFDRDEQEWSGDDAGPDDYAPAVHIEVTVDEDQASLDSLVAAFRAVLVASGFSSLQTKQVVVLPYSQVNGNVSDI